MVYPFHKDGNELVGFFAMRHEIQKMFEECAVSVRISLEQWFEHRMSNNENLRREHQWRIYSSILNLRADLEDKWSEISFDSQVRKWQDAKKKIDDDFIRAVANWERKCNSTKQKHERAVIAYKERQAEIKEYPTILAKQKKIFRPKNLPEKRNLQRKYQNMNHWWMNGILPKRKHVALNQRNQQRSRRANSIHQRNRRVVESRQLSKAQETEETSISRRTEEAP